MSTMQHNVHPDDRWLTIQELMEYVPLSERTLRKIAKELHPARVKGRGKLLIKKSEFDAWLTRHSDPAEAADSRAIELLKEVLTKTK
jgi:excisionase family DNA binding protein